MRAATHQRKGWQAWAALLCLTAQLGGHLHLALAEHATCAEHGEQIHGAESTALASAPAHPTDEGSPGVQQGAANLSEHGHDHCAVAVTQKTAARVDGPSDVVLSVVSFASYPADEQHPFVASIAILRLAPKGSPPSA